MYAVLGVIILVAISWIAKDSINHYFGLELFDNIMRVTRTTIPSAPTIFYTNRKRPLIHCMD